VWRFASRSLGNGTAKKAVCETRYFRPDLESQFAIRAPSIAELSSFSNGCRASETVIEALLTQVFRRPLE
jgi:hypothetical protein